MLTLKRGGNRILKSPAAKVVLPPEVRQSSRLPSRAISNSSQSATAPIGGNGAQALRVLYCGSDDFSCASLQALHQEHLRPSSNIASIDVLCRPGKPYGRGLKLVRDPKIKDVAKNMGLPVHQVETFTGWRLPEFKDSSNPKINLVIAVSFGLLIPPRILKEAKFSGLNLHPSMLPDYKGPAPLHWTILNGESKTGMTLQTLHPTSFDQGTILDQTPWPGIEIPEYCDYSYLLRIMKTLGAEMLVNAIRKGLYLSPHGLRDIAQNVEHSQIRCKYAPKIKTADRQLRFDTMDSSRILRMSRAFESMWAFAAVPQLVSKFKKQRLIFEGAFGVSSDSAECNKRVPEIPPGLPYWSIRVNYSGELINAPLLINTVDGKTISVESLKMEGDMKSPAYKVALKHRLIGQARTVGSQKVMPFHDVLNTEAWP